MESLKLDILTLISKQIHHHLEIRLIRDVSCHDRKVGTIKKDLAEEFEGLALGDVVCGHDQGSE